MTYSEADLNYYTVLYYLYHNWICHRNYF